MPNPKRLRVIFAGTPAFAAHHLQALLNSPHDLVGVYTQPDRPAGRGKKLKPSPVKELALTHSLSLYQPKTLKDEAAQQQLLVLEADVMVVVAYGLILPEAVLAIPTYGCLNVHGSLLPRWRGAAPIQRAIEAGDPSTGITIMQMDAGLDTGAMLSTSGCGIGPRENSASLHDKLMLLGPPALLEVLDQLPGGQLRPEAQDDTLATYADKISKEEALIDWSQTATEIDRKVRAFNPFPIAYSFLGEQRIKFYHAEPSHVTGSQVPPGTILNLSEEGLLLACGEGALLVHQLQLPGKKSMTAQALANGYRSLLTPGQQFSNQLMDASLG